MPQDCGHVSKRSRSRHSFKRAGRPCHPAHGSLMNYLAAVFPGRSLHETTRGALMVEPMEQGVVLVRGGAQGFVQEITRGRHRLLADERRCGGGPVRGRGPCAML